MNTTKDDIVGAGQLHNRDVQRLERQIATLEGRMKADNLFAKMMFAQIAIATLVIVAMGMIVRFL